MEFQWESSGLDNLHLQTFLFTQNQPLTVLSEVPMLDAPPMSFQRSHNATPQEPPSYAQNPVTSPMGPPARTRKRKAPTLRAADWEPYRARIIELHIEQRRPLPEVRTMLERESGFSAELRQYRTRISQWKLDKNIKPQEMQAIIRKQQERKLVETNKEQLKFSVRDTPVSVDKVERWMKKHNIPENSLYVPSPAASTPSAVKCWTENGSWAPSPANSMGSSSYSARTVDQPYQSPVPPSPASSISTVIRSSASTFTGQSPAPGYRALPVVFGGHIPTFHTTQVPPLSNPFQAFPMAAQTQLHTEHEATRWNNQRVGALDEQRLKNELSVLEVEYGPNHPEVLPNLIELGHLFLLQGRYASAETIARRALVVAENASENEDSLMPDALCLFGNVLFRQGFYDKAGKRFKRALELYSVALGPHHPNTLRSALAILDLDAQRGRWKEGEERGVRLLDIGKRTVGPEHKITLSVMNCLASIYLQQGRLGEAQSIYEECLKIQSILYGDEAANTLRMMGNLSLVYREKKELAKAEELCKRVVKVSSRVFGNEHPSTVSSSTNLAAIYALQGRLIEAEELLEQNLEISMRVLGEEHPDTGYIMFALAQVFHHQDRQVEAEELLQKTLDKHRKVSGVDHPKTLFSMHWLAETQFALGKKAEAIQLMTEVVEMRKEKIGSDHPATKKSMGKLQEWLYGQWIV